MSHSSAATTEIIEAEYGLLSTVFSHPKVMDKACQSVYPDDFTNPRLRLIWRVILKLHTEGRLKPCDAFLLEAALKEEGVSVDQEMSDTIHAIIGLYPSPAMAGEHARIIHEAAFLRTLAAKTTELTKSIAAGRGLSAALEQLDEIHRARESCSWHRNGRGDIACNCCANVSIEPITWLWGGRVANGKLSLIAGEPGLGKSVMTMDLAARLSSGRPFPGGGLGQAPGSVVVLSAEDGIEDTIVPRLIAAGADLSKITVLSEGGSGDISIPDDIPKIHEIVRAIGDVRLIIVDPISAYLGVGKVDSHNNTDVRSALKPLSKMAADLGIAVVAVTHLNKGQGSAIQRVIGSIAFVAAARAVFVVTADKEDESRCLVIPAKNNLAPLRDGFAYRLDTREVNDATGRSVGTLPVIAWEDGEVSISANDAVDVSERRPRGPAPDTRKAAEAWLISVLQNGPVPKRVIDNLVKEQSTFSRCSVDRARVALGIVSEKRPLDGSSVVHWILPGCGPIMSGTRNQEDETEAFM